MNYALVSWEAEKKLAEAVDRARKTDFAARAAHGVALSHKHEEGRRGMVSVQTRSICALPVALPMP